MSASHRHEEPQGEALAAAAQRRLEAAGERWTDLRAAVFGELATGEGPRSAYDLAEALSKREGRRVAANSVYRILDLFVAANLALKVESANAYVANEHPACEHDCAFLVCDGCGAAAHLDADDAGDLLRAAASRAGFAPQRPVIEVRGQCAACQAA